MLRYELTLKILFYVKGASNKYHIDLLHLLKMSRRDKKKKVKSRLVVAMDWVEGS